MWLGGDSAYQALHLKIQDIHITPQFKQKEMIIARAILQKQSKQMEYVE